MIQPQSITRTTAADGPGETPLAGPGVLIRYSGETIMCLLPPNCLFCRHFNQASEGDGPDCAAFEEIPEAVFRGEVSHTAHLPGDGGFRFELDPAYSEDFAEVVAVREAMLRQESANRGVKGGYS